MKNKRELTPEELEAFLAETTRWIALSTLDPDGYPHTVPMGYFRYEGDFYMGSKHPTRKTRNIERNPRVSLLLENGRGKPELIGVLMQGQAEVIVDPARLLALKRTRDPAVTEVAEGIAYIRVRPERIVTWWRG